MIVYENMIDELNFNYELDSMNALFETYLVEFKLDIRGFIDKVVSFFKETVPKYITIIKNKISDFIHKLKKEDIRDRTKRIIKEIQKNKRIVEINAKDIDINDDSFKNLDITISQAVNDVYRFTTSIKPFEFFGDKESRNNNVETKMNSIINNIDKYAKYEVLPVSSYVYFPEPKSGKLQITSSTLENIFNRNTWNKDLGQLSDGLNGMEKMRKEVIDKAETIKKLVNDNDNIDKSLVSKYLSTVMSTITNVIKMLNTEISVQISIINYFHDLIIKIEDKLKINLPANREELYD